MLNLYTSQLRKANAPYSICYGEKTIRYVLFINKVCNIIVLPHRVREKNTVLAAMSE